MARAAVPVAHRALGNQRAPGMSRLASTAAGGAEAVTAKCAQTEPQNPSRSRRTPIPTP